MHQIQELQEEGLTGVDLIKTWLTRRIFPLRSRDHPMWQYTGVSDSTRILPREHNAEQIFLKLKNLTMETNDLGIETHVVPYSAHYPLPEVSACVFRHLCFICYPD